MVSEEEKTGNACEFSGEKTAEPPVVPAEDKAAEDNFYEKLSQLNESSGLSLLFNFREAKFDLHMLYKEVIKRGGFHQVMEAGKWDEVESVLNLKSVVSVSPAQLQRLYQIILLHFEQMYFKKAEEANMYSDKSSLDDSRSCWIGKRKHCDSSSLSQICFDDLDGLAEKRKSNGGTSNMAAGSKTVNPSSTMSTTMSKSDEKVLRKDSNAPMKPRTGYQIFLRLECQRLKLIHGESSASQNIRDMATNAWRCLSDKDKLPYIAAGKMDKERYEREMAYYNNWRATNDNANENQFSNSNPRMLNFATSLETESDYRVSLQSEQESTTLFPDESMVELAIKVMKNAESSDAMFQIDWDAQLP